MQPHPNRLPSAPNPVPHDAILGRQVEEGRSANGVSTIKVIRAAELTDSLKKILETPQRSKPLGKRFTGIQSLLMWRTHKRDKESPSEKQEPSTKPVTGS